MKKFLGMLVTTLMVFGMVSSVQACNCGCNTAATNCGCAQNSCAKQGCPVTKEEFAKKIAERQAKLNADLGLTKEQQDKAKVIFDAKFKAIAPVMTEIKAKKQALHELKASSFDVAKIKAKQEQKTALKNELATLKAQRKEISAKYDSEFEAMLSEEQKVKWAQIKAEMKERHKQHRHHHCDSCGCQIKM